MRRSIEVFSLLALLAAVPVLASTAARTPSGVQTDLDAMVAADREFGRFSETRPVKEMFLTYLADEATLFRGGEAVPGKEWTAGQESPPFKLFLRPAWAGISGSGDLGWTADPYDLHPDGADEVHYGEYLTVWKKQLDGQWRFVVNSGVHTPRPDGPAPAAPKVVQGGEAVAGKAKRPAAEVTAELLAADRDLGQATAGGTSAAYLARLADDGILMRNGSPALEGREAVRGALAKAPARMASRPVAGGVSAAGDLGYTWGTAEWTAGDGPVKANYLRIWEKRDGAWKLSVDCVAEAPVPQPDPPQPDPPKS